MNVIVVDDERIILNTITNSVKRVLPLSNVESFRVGREALDYAKTTNIDIAFLDINMKGITGLELAKELKSYNEKVNIIFCTGYSEYSLEALDLYCSGYLMKPVTDEKLLKSIENLRYPVSDKIPNLYIECFGNFAAFYNNTPIKFKNKKTLELLAYLIDRKGASCSTKDILATIFENDDQDSYVRNLRSDLYDTFKKLGISDALVRVGGNVAVNKDRIECDYYNYLKGNNNLFKGEYMSQYSFSEKTLSLLLEKN